MESHANRQDGQHMGVRQIQRFRSSMVERPYTNNDCAFSAPQVHLPKLCFLLGDTW
ncbi:unnamed protein product [Strongylus vulgaris]|uniref:Uncharacterized protein n=1 Tax=Strongylus vulgaris TaxID=40348 RepID=A0A3P7J0E5_STRVU|nr:unnamed protein product [Strongylus vulgaris]